MVLSTLGCTATSDGCTPSSRRWISESERPEHADGGLTTRAYCEEQP
jgi:hypothetical protein